jgi:hypothetical protein
MKLNLHSKEEEKLCSASFPYFKTSIGKFTMVIMVNINNKEGVSNESISINCN